MVPRVGGRVLLLVFGIREEGGPKRRWGLAFSRAELTFDTVRAGSERKGRGTGIPRPARPDQNLHKTEVSPVPGYRYRSTFGRPVSSINAPRGFAVGLVAPRPVDVPYWRLCVS